MEFADLLKSKGDVLAIFCRVVFFSFCFEALFRLLLYCLPKQPKVLSDATKLSTERFRVLLSINLISCIHATVGSLVAIYGLFSDDNMSSIIRHLLKWEYEPLHEQILVVEETRFCGALITMTIGYFVWDLCNSSIQEQFDTMMTLHHIISIVVWPIALYYGLAHFFLLYSLATELSSPLMHLRWYFRNIYGKEFLWLVTTVSFVLMFTIVRMVAMPFILFGLYCSNSWRHSALPPWLQVLSTSTLYLPSLLNLWWYFYTMKMCYNFLCGKSKSKKT